MATVAQSGPGLARRLVCGAQHAEVQLNLLLSVSVRGAALDCVAPSGLLVH